MRHTEHAFFAGPPLPWPTVHNTLAVPSDGYARLLALDPNAAAVSRSLDHFDGRYTAILADLDAAWSTPGCAWSALARAVAAAAELRALARFSIVCHEVPPGAVARLAALDPDEYALLERATDLSVRVCYGPRFRNQAALPAVRPDLSVRGSSG